MSKVILYMIFNVLAITFLVIAIMWTFLFWFNRDTLTFMQLIKSLPTGLYVVWICYPVCSIIATALSTLEDKE